MYKAFDESEGLEVAWNQVKVNDLLSSPAERERLFAEIRVLKQLKCVGRPARPRPPGCPAR